MSKIPSILTRLWEYIFYVEILFFEKIQFQRLSIILIRLNNLEEKSEF